MGLSCSSILTLLARALTATVPGPPTSKTIDMRNYPKARIEAVRVALHELADPSAEMVSAFVAKRFGLDIPPQLVPVIRAIIADRERLSARRAVSDKPENPDGAVEQRCS